MHGPSRLVATCVYVHEPPSRCSSETREKKRVERVEVSKRVEKGERERETEKGAVGSR